MYDRAKHLKNVLDVSRGQNTGARADVVLADPDATETQREAARIVTEIIELDREEKLAYFDTCGTPSRTRETSRRSRT